MTGFSGTSRIQRLYRHREAPPRRIAERRRKDPATDSRTPTSTEEGRATALRTAGARKRRPKNYEMPPPTRAEVGASATSVEARSTLFIHTMACADSWSTGLAILKSE